MIKSIWFDLDGTLLYNDMENFSKEYFTLIAEKISYLGNPEFIISNLQKAVYYMMENKGPKTNEEAFWDKFISLTNMDKDKLWEFFDKFYREDFPRLKHLTRPHPYARKVVKLAFDLGLKVVIATNAVFPLVAIKERLSWAGIEDFPYYLITSMEIMHSCKPHLEYYREILDFVKEEPENCLMVGNDVREDISAKKLLINTYLVINGLTINELENNLTPDFKAPLEDLLNILPLLSKN